MGLPLWNCTKRWTQYKREGNKVSVVKVYVNAIKDGDIQITDVPQSIQDKVKELLKEDEE
ncbi:hypothetical protein AMI01nite_62250 [Aneurinibacillus migulanus]|nr:hypothetical protein AMI01nite_62250 [Aneurinibacillus migulanus]